MEISRRLDVHADDEVAALVGLLALGHAEVGEALCEVGSSWAAAADGDLLSVDGLDGSLPTGQRFLEVEGDGMLDVVAFALEERVWFLCHVSFVSCAN